MTKRNFITKGILPLVGLLILTWLGQYIFMVNGEIDWFRCCLVYGIPFGIPYTVFVIPIGGSATNSVVCLVLSIVIGAVFGCVIAAGVAIRSVVFIIGFLIRVIVR